MRVEAIMTREVLRVQDDAPLQEAIRSMLHHGVGGLVVVDRDERLVGILTEGDMLRRSEPGNHRHRPRWLQIMSSAGKTADQTIDPAGRLVRDVMSRWPRTVTEETLIADAAELMERNRIKRVPVMRGAMVVGILTRANFMRGIASVAARPELPPLSDAAIGKKLTSELRAQPWAPPKLLEIIVCDGVVDLWGSIADERTRTALIASGESTPGVKLVRDHLVWVGAQANSQALPAAEVSDNDIARAAQAVGLA